MIIIPNKNNSLVIESTTAFRMIYIVNQVKVCSYNNPKNEKIVVPNVRFYTIYNVNKKKQ